MRRRSSNAALFYADAWYQSSSHRPDVARPSGIDISNAALYVSGVGGDDSYATLSREVAKSPRAMTAANAQPDARATPMRPSDTSVRARPVTSRKRSAATLSRWPGVIRPRRAPPADVYRNHLDNNAYLTKIGRIGGVVKYQYL